MSIGLSSALERGRPRPFDLASLLEMAGITMTDAARALGKARRQIQRWADIGLTIDQADDAAVLLGFHPAEVWGERFIAEAQAEAEFSTIGIRFRKVVALPLVLCAGSERAGRPVASATPHPRALCPQCGRPHAVNPATGTLRRHGRPGPAS